MDWITEKQVMRAVKDGIVLSEEAGIDAAIDITVLHWQQLCRATKGELLELDKDYLKEGLCGLCVRKKLKASSCYFCLLAKKVGECEQNINNPWYRACTEFWQIVGEHAFGTVKEFRVHARKMRDIVKEIQSERRPQKKRAKTREQLRIEMRAIEEQLRESS